MIIKIPSHISRTFVQQHEELIFVYGYDLRGLGIMGQAWALHGEPNAYGVPTLERYCPSQKVFFDDSLFTHYANHMDDAVDKIAQVAFITKRPVIVCPKIGMGCSRLYEIAPKLYDYMTKRLNLIKHQNIEWNYGTPTNMFRL